MQRIKVSSICNICTQFRSLTTTPVKYLNQKWRQERKLPMNPNNTTVLSETSDYSFLDGRITPYGTRQRKRILRQREVLTQILALSREIDFAVDRHEMLKQEAENKKRRILANKLKPKGIELLKSTSKKQNK